MKELRKLFYNLLYSFVISILVLQILRFNLRKVHLRPPSWTCFCEVCDILIYACDVTTGKRIIAMIRSGVEGICTAQFTDVIVIASAIQMECYTFSNSLQLRMVQKKEKDENFGSISAKEKPLFQA